MKVLLTVAYDGTEYCGFQRQYNGITIQEKIEDALAVLFRTKIAVFGASRTDSGVHAFGQRVSFSVEPMRIPLMKLPYAINTHLPEDIKVNLAEEVPENFNPRWASDKKYIYQIYNSNFPNPLLRNYAWFVPGSLDIDKMREAASAFVGSHDFTAFCAAGSGARTTIRTIYSCEISKEDELITISIRGNSFLYNMVRIIAGTIVFVGQDKIPARSVSEIILSRNRTLAGKTAPPNGLYLKEVNYSQVAEINC